ncbi:tRNA ligase phosphodiesterase [Penicillium coprophilum]|uniref:tRNA ligase phosphodiesterase n=1 Tax=Penicillium coprophilum TaxID=36646 RepID=UPI00238AF4F5|nr:tRNA ligase phosphodiesterase [Penicillium coprophilum]KAJ5158996.1 tRNA ligase phosphodiesterase [Penicillium coprophilum]
MATQDPHVISQLVKELETARKAKKGETKFTCKKSTFVVAGTNNVTVDSWKFMDWDYKHAGLPTYARGLFTTKRRDGTPEIATRGYDKFFNVGETKTTEWRNIEKNTRGPYELSVKENGCIIFISALEDDTLLVCSKHSTGARDDTKLSHAQAGERWTERHVSSVNRSVKDLARTLRRMNVTAVGELCDDSFEEHVLAYDEASSGIYIHGLNYNQPDFQTMSSDEVHKFADDWGFKKAKFEVFDDIFRVQSFLEGCAETGTWDGRETEGFVIRCQLSDKGTEPYRHWFFKYKFEEPYLMYRQWRECTKAVIAGKHPKIRKHEQVTEEYLQFARRTLMKNSKMATDYMNNHGIIALREAFLKERGLNGSELIALEAKKQTEPHEVNKNVILEPIASLGCGKTTLALALVKLFGWGHVQNDNIPKQKNKPKKFAFEVSHALSEHSVVIADRNNHQRRERTQLMDDIYPVIPDAQFVALHYVHEPKRDLLPAIREVTRKRVLERGDNHQTIRAGSNAQEEIVGIMEGFLGRFEGVDSTRVPDMNLDHVIDLDVCASSRENLETVVKALHAAYPRLVPTMPTAAELDEAIAASLDDYTVTTDLSYSYSSTPKQKNKNKTQETGRLLPEPTDSPFSPEALSKKIEYFNISLPAKEITSILQSLFPPKSNPETARLYNQLIHSRRLQPSFHVTLIHRASKKDNPETWNYLTTRYIDTQTKTPVSNPIQHPPTLGSARVRIERLVWDNRIMAFVARILPAEGAEAEGAQASGAAEWPCANPIAHITVGTASPDVKPKESNDLLQRWVEVGSGGNTGIFEAEVEGVKVVDGVVGLVMSRGKY